MVSMITSGDISCAHAGEIVSVSLGNCRSSTLLLDQWSRHQKMRDCSDARRARVGESPSWVEDIACADGIKMDSLASRHVALLPPAATQRLKPPTAVCNVRTI